MCVVNRDSTGDDGHLQNLHVRIVTETNEEGPDTHALFDQADFVFVFLPQMCMVETC